MKKQYLLMGALLAAMAMPVLKARTVTISAPRDALIWISGHPKHGTAKKLVIYRDVYGERKPRALNLDKRTEKSDLYLVNRPNYIWAKAHPGEIIDVWKFEHPFFVPLSKFITASIKILKIRWDMWHSKRLPVGGLFFERYDSGGKSYLSGKQFYGSKHKGRVLPDGSVEIKSFWEKWKKIG